MATLSEQEEKAMRRIRESYGSEFEVSSMAGYGFRTGFTEGVNYNKARIEELEAKLAEIELQYKGIIERAKYTKNPLVTTGLACAITGKSLLELEYE